MHKIKSTFWTRKGQFEKDRNSEAFGIVREALDGDGDYVCLIEGRNGIFRREKEVIRNFISQRSYWESRRGKVTAIVPLSMFEFIPAKKEQITEPML
jgi:hypothetical protein